MSSTATVPSVVEASPILPLLAQLAPEIVPGSFEGSSDARPPYDVVAQLTYPAFTEPARIVATKTGTSSWEGTSTWFGDWRVEWTIDDAED